MFAFRLLQIVFLSAGVTNLFPNASYAATPAAEHFKYVADAVNQINFLRAKSQNIMDNSKDIVDEACKMLTELVSDDEFKNMLLKGFSKPSSSELKEIMSDLSQVNNVIDKEMEALQNVGFDKLTSIQALAAALPLASRIDPSKISTETILSDISNLQRNACSLAGQIENTEKWEKKENAVVMGVSGVTLVVADSVAAYYTGGAASYIVQFSYPFGTALMGLAIDRLSGQ